MLLILRHVCKMNFKKITAVDGKMYDFVIGSVKKVKSTYSNLYRINTAGDHLFFGGSRYIKLSKTLKYVSQTIYSNYYV